MGLLDAARARAHAALDRVPGRVGERLRGLNEALGRPLADTAELADRRAFTSSSPSASPSPSTSPKREAAPVIVYYMDKQRRDALKLAEILESHGVPHAMTNIQEDPAAQYAVRRDSNGARLPVVFIAGECIGGRIELVHLASSGELETKVFG
jgi:glutaredoxin-related protein